MAASEDALSSLKSLLSEEEATRAREQIGDHWEKIKWVFDIASRRVADVEVKFKKAVAKANSDNINAGSFSHGTNNNNKINKQQNRTTEMTKAKQQQ